MTLNDKKIKKIINSLEKETDLLKISEVFQSFDLRNLHSLLDLLHQDSNFRRTEYLEQVLKVIIKPYLSKVISGEDARVIAKFQQQLGFIMKYKSYAVKATTILGYSVFLQNEGEGFSFQRHISHKTEIFLILKKKPNGFVFICDYELWKQNYARDSFNSWLAGKTKNEFYDTYKYEPESGDVFIIDKLGIVHTVIGCDLIEYATVSTDMVERLHDQNQGKDIPSTFKRSYADEEIKELSVPGKFRQVNFISGKHVKQLIEPQDIPGGKKLILQNSLFDASIYFINPKSMSNFLIHTEYSRLLHILSGNGFVLIAGRDELASTENNSIKVDVGDIILIPKGIYLKFINPSNKTLIISEHGINSNTALI